jgi:subtilisin family serine protease
MKRSVIFILILIFLSLSVNASNSHKIDSSLIEKSKLKEINIIVELEDENFLNKNEIKKISSSNRKYNNLVALKVDNKKLNELIDSGIVKSIQENVPFSKDIEENFSKDMQDTVGIINASSSWNLLQNSTNLTGLYETVCIIDTGTNFTHPDLLNKNKTCIINCYNQDCAEDCTSIDDDGHGTHVAGTIAALGTINGIAKNANLISLKVLDGDGNAHPSTGTLDIKNAIDWCVQNKNIYNISVISMSLGTQSLYTTYCDATFSLTLGKAINNATFYNISVIASTGNDGSSSAISSPACITNTTAVSATNKDDTIASYSNYNTITDFFAPGTSIYSTNYLSGYSTSSGTSMSTPHVAGAFAILSQFYKQQTSQTPSSKILEDALKNTGKNISLSTYNITRINIYDAIIKLDSLAPEVNLISPLTNTLNYSSNQTFSCNATDLSLHNLTFFIWNSTSLVNSTSFLLSTESYNKTSITIYNLPFETYKWNCLFEDFNSNSAYATSNNTLIIGGVSTLLTYPSNGFSNKINYTEFNCTSYSETNSELSNSTFFIWNSTSLLYNETKSILGVSNISTFNYTFLNESNYFWNCLSVNNNSNSTYFSSNYSVSYDYTNPNITSLESPSEAYSSTAGNPIVFKFNVSDNLNLSSCSLLFSNSLVAINSSTIINNDTNNITYSPSAGTYTWAINCSDFAGNTFLSSSRNITITAVSSNNLGGGGGGGGSSSTSISYNPSTSEMLSGYSKNLLAKDKISLEIFDSTGYEHYLTINKIEANSVDLTIFSTPLNLVLVKGESKKLSLSSSISYDLFIQLKNITNNKAEIFVQKINEPLIQEEPVLFTKHENLNETPQPFQPTEVQSSSIKPIIYLALILGLFFGAFKLLKRLEKNL